MTPSPPSRRRAIVAILLLATVLPLGCLLGSGVRAPRRMWTDELLSWVFLTDPSLTHMLAAQRDLINASPPLYFIVGRAWVAAFGAAETSLRLFSSLAFAGALVIVAALCRRRFGLMAALLGAAVAFFTMREIRVQNMEVRFYGLLALEMALLLWIYASITSAPRPGFLRWATQSALAAALVMTHYLGLLFLPLLAAAYALTQWRQRRFDWRPYVSLAVGLAPFLPWWPVFVHHQAISTAWTPDPTLKNLAIAMGIVGTDTFRAPLALFFSLLFAVWWQRRLGIVASADDDAPHNQPLLILAGLWVLFPVALWALALLGPRLFLPRYYFHADLAWAVLIAWAAARWRRMLLSSAMRRAGNVIVAAVIVAVIAVFLQKSRAWHSHDNYSPALVSPIPDDALPVVFVDAQTFLPSAHYSAQRDRMVYLLDAGYPTWPDAPQTTTAEETFMIALSRQYPAQHITPAPDFLASHSAFLFFAPDSAAWLRHRITDVGGYRVTPVRCPDGELYLIQR